MRETVHSERQQRLINAIVKPPVLHKLQVQLQSSCLTKHFNWRWKLCSNKHTGGYVCMCQQVGAGHGTELSTISTDINTTQPKSMPMPM